MNNSFVPFSTDPGLDSGLTFMIEATLQQILIDDGLLDYFEDRAFETLGLYDDLRSFSSEPDNYPPEEFRIQNTAKDGVDDGVTLRFSLRFDAGKKAYVIEKL